MSSIYDALRRIQGEKGSWIAPLERKGPTVVDRGKIGWIAAGAVALVLVCSAGVYLMMRDSSGEEAKVPPSPAAVQGAPAPMAASLPQAVPAAAPPDRAFQQAPAAPASPETLEGHLAAGDRYFTEKDYANALLSYTKALHYFGKDVRVLNNIGNVYLAQGQPAKAIHYFEESNGISKDHVEPVYNLACAYARLGDPARAVLNLRKACRLDPEAKKWAATDPDLSILRGRRDFDRMIGAQ